jgi:hypothetical protein
MILSIISSIIVEHYNIKTTKYRILKFPNNEI